MKNLVKRLNLEINEKVSEIAQRINDWYITTIRHFLRTLTFDRKDEQDSGYYFGLTDPCDVDHNELEAMRRMFIRIAENYA